jgi:hypothetical protein
MVQERHNPKRRQLFAESRLVSEYLAETYPGAQWFVNLRIGATGTMDGVDLTDPGQVGLLRNRNRYADAVVVTPAELVVVEGTMWQADAKVGQLQAYMMVVRFTPALLPYLERPVVGELVTGQDDPLAAAICRRAGIRYVHYEPPWIDDFYAAYPHRRRRPTYVGGDLGASLSLDDGDLTTA